MGSSRNTGVTAAQMGMVGSEMKIEFVHGGERKQTRKILE